jgi:hypothetical protein
VLQRNRLLQLLLVWLLHQLLLLLLLLQVQVHQLMRL